MLAALCYAKEEPIHLSTITSTAEPPSVEVMKLFRQKVGSHEKLVDNSDSSVLLLFTVAASGSTRDQCNFSGLQDKQTELSAGGSGSGASEFRRDWVRAGPSRH
jgi:hypothetical protein